MLPGRTDDDRVDHLAGKLKPELKPTIKHDKRAAYAALRMM